MAMALWVCADCQSAAVHRAANGPQWKVRAMHITNLRVWCRVWCLILRCVACPLNLKCKTHIYSEYDETESEFLNSSGSKGRSG